jgi:hypothetical protein
MMLYSFQGSRPVPLPFRITLPNGFTRTDPSTFTEGEITAAGFSGPYVEPPYNPATEQLGWADGAFVVEPLPPQPPAPVLDLTATANGILVAAATNDAAALASLLNDLVEAVRR